MDLKKVIIQIKEDFFLKAFNDSSFDLNIMKMFNLLFSLIASRFDKIKFIGDTK